MTHACLIRAWKDEEYRQSLSEVEQALLPECPAGTLELADADLDRVAGGDGCYITVFIGFCRLTVGRCGVTVCAGSVGIR